MSAKKPSYLAANIAPIRTYVAQASYQSERTTQLSLIQAAQSFGFVVGPGIQAAFAPIGCSSQASSGSPYFSLDTYTSCGWCISFIGALCLVLFMPKVFVEHNVVLAQARLKRKFLSTTYVVALICNIPFMQEKMVQPINNNHWLLQIIFL